MHVYMAWSFTEWERQSVTPRMSAEYTRQAISPYYESCLELICFSHQYYNPTTLWLYVPIIDDAKHLY